MSLLIPTGMVTFLFTDVVGSTRSWEADPSGMAASIELHDSIVRSGAEVESGHVFSTAGDGFGVAFTNPHEAIAAAVGIQLALLAADWPGPALSVRMGLHSGTVDERDGDYFGPAVNRAARLQAASHGGRILVSAASAESARPLLAAGASLADLGTHHLKDLDEPEHIFEVRHPELPVVTEPIKGTGSHAHNLPDYLTTFIGRQEQLVTLKEMLVAHRLVVLTGVGGTGKTRLAVEASRRNLGAHPDGVWLVELAPVTDPALVMTTVGETWGLRPGEGASIDEVVTRYLRTKELLVIVDNCEHLLGSAAAAIRQLLDSSPGVRVVATSRESLGIPGEALLQVPSLGLPTDGRPADSEAAQLFFERARSAQPGYVPSEDDLAAIGRICHRVDGIPLGIELAAARMRSMSAVELADRLEDSFRILAGSGKASLPRQRTLSATIDWSHDLLEPPEAALFRRLAVFAGGFDLEAAEAVCPGDGVEQSEVVDLVDSLIDKSLVLPIRDRSGSTATRYRLLEPVRQYAQEKLGATDEAVGFRRKHARHFGDLVARASPGLRGPEQIDWRARIDADYANIRAAFTNLYETGDIEGHLAMAFDLFPYWMSGGMQIEAVDTALVGLEADNSDTDPRLRAKVWWTTAMLGAQITRPHSVDYARQGLALAEALGDDNLRGRMELVLGAAIAHATTDPAFGDHLVEGRRLVEDHPGEAWWEPEWDRAVLDALLFEYLPPDDPRRLEHFEAATAGFELIGDDAFLSIPLTMAIGLGESIGEDKVTDHLRRAIEITERISVPLWRGHARFYLGTMLARKGDHTEAIEHIASGAADLEECGDLSCWAAANRFQAMSQAALGNTEEARRRLVDVIAAIPDLPVQELHKVRAVDAAVAVLLAAGEAEQAAWALGLAEAIELTVPLGVDRALEAAKMRGEIVAVLGEDKTQVLGDEGAASGLDEGLAAIRRWLAPAEAVSASD